MRPQRARTSRATAAGSGVQGWCAPATRRGAQAGMAAAAAAARSSCGRPPRSGTAPISTLFTLAGNAAASLLVAAMPSGRRTPAGRHYQCNDFFWAPVSALLMLPQMPPRRCWWPPCPAAAGRLPGGTSNLRNVLEQGSPPACS